jgi:hypothetical protein
MSFFETDELDEITDVNCDYKDDEDKVQPPSSPWGECEKQKGTEEPASSMSSR